MVRKEDGMVELRPIAGTRPRGKTEEEDKRLIEELLGDPKERAEHIMLLDSEEMTWEEFQELVRLMLTNLWS